ncbi:hypothetical protein LOTGIDRAFT_236237 [Lottia gigantea]|uniref:EF-hand domain-containing protein n=1 Tax=Lottia gigantea TaxID=225164 RepID=V4B7K8_LOTGI|nr:hypothetical protein LOTGIDRAFT_236237 [Lottia gigantea]ESO84594.1 hypothetical protein LOTGIDRAFT_236237 [Lottia gigantea]
MGNGASVQPSKAEQDMQRRMTLIESQNSLRCNPVEEECQSLSPKDLEAMKIDPKDYNFSFENLVLEGGGIKGAAYVGALRYMEEIGLAKKIKRFAGSSAGAMCACYLAVGYGSEDISNFLEPKYISSVLNDNPWGVLNLLPNMINSFGWKPTSKVYNEMGKHIEKKVGDADITFKQLYKKKGIELCICVTNVNRMNVTFCHVKTTPHLPIRRAVCMSMSIPGYFQASKETLFGSMDVYVDGGLLCNYPIHCFDGWYLSLKPDDSFLTKFTPLSNLTNLYDPAVRFGGFNEKTLGFQVYSDYEQDLMKTELDKRVGVLIPAKPSQDTKLYRKLLDIKKKQKKVEKIHACVMDAVNAFLVTIHKHNIADKASMDLGELKLVFEDKESFTDKHCELLFGEVISAEEAFDSLDKDEDGQVDFGELMEFIQRTGICMLDTFQGYSRQEISGFSSFVERVQNTILLNLKRVHANHGDYQRTVGINTGHIETVDFDNMVYADQKFVEERGYNAMKAFLQYHVINKDHTETQNRK